MLKSRKTPCKNLLSEHRSKGKNVVLDFGMIDSIHSERKS
jgi:hypothetical protein